MSAHKAVYPPVYKVVLVQECDGPRYPLCRANAAARVFARFFAGFDREGLAVAFLDTKLKLIGVDMDFSHRSIRNAIREDIDTLQVAEQRVKECVSGLTTGFMTAREQAVKLLEQADPSRYVAGKCGANQPVRGRDHLPPHEREGTSGGQQFLCTTPSAHP